MAVVTEAHIVSISSLHKPHDGYMQNERHFCEDCAGKLRELFAEGTIPEALGAKRED